MMNTSKAIDIAINALTEKLEADRLVLRLIERKPEAVEYVDKRTERRYRKYQDAIQILRELRKDNGRLPHTL